MSCRKVNSQQIEKADKKESFLENKGENLKNAGASFGWHDIDEFAAIKKYHLTMSRWSVEKSQAIFHSL